MRAAARTFCSNVRIALVYSNSAEMDRDAAERIDLEREALLVRRDCQRRHYRAGDDDLARPQPFAECRQHVGDVAHDADPLSGIGLWIGGACEFLAVADDATGQPV